MGSSGAANYSIPLWGPPGVGKVQLKLGLVYNSRSADGVTGVGWSLSGLSAITRCNRTWAQDGYAQGITLTTSDRLCLDGQQLKVVTGTPSAPAQGGTTFATEVESFSQITAAGSSGSAPTSLTVTTKNGLIYDYGLTVDSQILAGPTGPVRTWALSQVRDRVGNAIKFSYYNDAESGSGYTDGSYRVKEIDYPYTASGQGPFYSVTFAYGPRPTAANVPLGYVAGSLVQEPNELNTISIQNYGSSTPTKAYALTYATSTVSERLRLTNIQECSASNCLPPTTIAYQGGAQGWSGSQTAVSSSSGLVGPIAVDLNGDGLTDLLVPVTNGTGTVRWYAHFSTGSGYSSPVDTTLTTNATDVLFPGQFLGSGAGQQVLVPQNGSFYLLTCTTSACSSVPTGVPSVGVFAVADWDGDGLQDIAAVSGSSVTVRRNTTIPPGAISFESTPSTVWTIPAGHSPQAFQDPATAGFTSADFNGDGRADLLVVTTASTGGKGDAQYIWALISNGFSSLATASELVGAGGQYLYVTVGDLNGDGCSDIFTDLDIFISNCAGGFTKISTPDNNQNGPPLAVDWDGDGRTDYLYIDSSSNEWYVARSLGTSLATPEPLGISAPLGTSWFVLDQDGDGQVDLGVYNSTTGQISYYRHAGASTPPDLAISFTDGFGMNQSPTYAPISQNYYTKYSDATFPEEDYQGSLYVVNQFTSSDGTGSTYQNQFWYYGLRVQAQGRGLEGFYARRTFDTRNSLYAYDYFGRTFPWTGMFVQRSVLQNNDSTFITTWSADTASQASGGSGYETRTFPFLSSSTETDREFGGSLNGTATKSVNRTYSYGDGYGNLTELVTSTTDTDPMSPFDGQTWVSDVNSTYLNDNSSAWCLGIPEQITVKNTAPGQTIQTRTYGYTPDSNHAFCREQQHIVEPNTAALTVTAALAFDSCGNVNSVAVTGHNPDGSAMATRTTGYNYGFLTGRCQFPEQLTNALGQTATIAYYYNFGVPNSVTDANGAAISWTYDDFGRTNKELRPDGTSTTWGLSSCAQPPCWSPADLRTIVTRQEYDSNGSNFNTRALDYDGFNRLRYDQSYRVLGTWTYNQVLIYDSLGRVVAAYQPFSSTGNGYWSAQYDSLNRMSQASLYQSSGSLDRTETWAYQGRTTTFQDPLGYALGYSTSLVSDVLGLPRQVRDPAPGGTTSYAYDAFGNLNQATDEIGTQWTALYNLRGFRIQVVDPDSGTWGFEGDSLNELVAWTDAKSQSFGAAYDALGRMTSRTEPEGTSSWTWGSTASLHNIGALQAKSGLGYSESLAYDAIGRLSTRVITTDQSYEYIYDYNPVGALGAITYPASPPPTGTTATNFAIQIGYSYGYPYQITDITQSTPTVLWTLSGVNDYSSPTAESFSNASGTVVSVQQGYKAWTGELTSIQSGVPGSSTNRQNLAYTWDVDGNLKQRQDSNQSVTEVFSYDALDRLVSSTLNGAANLSVNYVNGSGVDQAGNIVSRSDVGSYTYGDTHHPHGVTAAGGSAFAYDANGNVVTRNGLSLGWASFNLPISLQASVGGSSYSSAFAYGPEHQRYTQTATYSNGSEITEYAGGLLEKVSGTDTGGITAWRHYVPTPSGLTMVVSRNSDGSTSTTYALSDHLGSSDALVSGSTTGAGTLLIQESFGAFGQRRQSNWSAGSPSPTNYAAIAETTRRGFAFQEELDNINLIHMNGRVYDPNVGRFLSTDQLIGSLADSQSLNPYAYVGNRPLSFTDPTGQDPVTDTVTIIASSGGPEDPVGDALAVADLAFDIFGLVGGASPPPPPASVEPNGSAQSNLGMNPCETPSSACGGLEIVADSSGPSTPIAPGPDFPTTGEIQLPDPDQTWGYRWGFPGSSPPPGPDLRDWMIAFPPAIAYTLYNYYTAKLPTALRVPAQAAPYLVGGPELGGAKLLGTGIKFGGEIAGKLAADATASAVGDAARGVAGLAGRSGLSAFGETAFRGLVQNRALAELTDSEVRAAFQGTRYALSNHAVSRLLDPRTADLGIRTLNDIAGVLNKGVVGNAGGGLISIVRGGFGAIIDPTTNIIVTFRPF